MSVQAAARRRRRQHAIGHTHLAKICGKSVKGGRPIYRRGKSTGSVAEAIARERAYAQKEAARRAKKK